GIVVVCCSPRDLSLDSRLRQVRGRLHPLLPCLRSEPRPVALPAHPEAPPSGLPPPARSATAPSADGQTWLCSPPPPEPQLVPRPRLSRTRTPSPPWRFHRWRRPGCDVQSPDWQPSRNCRCLRLRPVCE